MKIDNNIMINKIIDSDKNIYLIMDLCLFNLEEYINMRKEKLSIDEIKKILLDLNKSLKIMIEKKIIHGNIKLSNILISLNQTNQLSFNLNIYDSIQFNNKLDSMSITNQKPVLSNSPEILKGENISNKSDIWSVKHI
jgi:serine/threonine protein kinase